MRRISKSVGPFPVLREERLRRANGRSDHCYRCGVRKKGGREIYACLFTSPQGRYTLWKAVIRLIVNLEDRSAESVVFCRKSGGKLVSAIYLTCGELELPLDRYEAPSDTDDGWRLLPAGGQRRCGVTELLRT